MRDQQNQRGPGSILRKLNRIFCHGWHRLPRDEFVLPDGPVILVGNHLCGLDPLLIQAAVNRPLSFLMSRDYYQSMWYLRRGFDRIGAIPVSPGGANRQALRTSMEVLKQGHALCLFPEGAVNPPIPLHRILPGASMLARESGAPVIPFRISGVWPFDHVHMWPPFIRRSRARVSLGEPIDFSEHDLVGKDALEKDSAVIRRAIRRLRG